MARLEITPEPTPEERAAIKAAVTELSVGEPPRSAWWHAGVREEEDADADVLSPCPPTTTRTSPGL